jgi:hypothetical protein
MFIPDPAFSIPDPELTRSRIRMCIKEFKYFYFKKQDQGCSSRIPDLDFFSIPDPGVKKAADPGSATH